MLHTSRFCHVLVSRGNLILWGVVRNLLQTNMALHCTLQKLLVFYCDSFHLQATRLLKRGHVFQLNAAAVFLFSSDARRPLALYMINIRKDSVQFETQFLMNNINVRYFDLTVQLRTRPLNSYGQNVFEMIFYLGSNSKISRKHNSSLDHRARTALCLDLHHTWFGDEARRTVAGLWRCIGIAFIPHPR